MARSSPEYDENAEDDASYEDSFVGICPGPSGPGHHAQSNRRVATFADAIMTHVRIMEELWREVPMDASL